MTANLSLSTSVATALPESKIECAHLPPTECVGAASLVARYHRRVHVVLDGRGVRSETELHRELARLLDFGPFYGANFDALWDRLSTDVERPVHLLWEESGASRAAMGSLTFDRIEQVLRKAAEQDAAFNLTVRFTYELA